MLSGPPTFMIAPPPARLAELPRKLLVPSTVRAPLFQMAPPPWLSVVAMDWLAVNVQLLRVAEPSVAMAPPSTEKLLANNAPWTVRLPLLLMAPPPTVEL